LQHRILAAMSGGVDSSVTALKLSENGFDVVGVMMKLYENEDIGESILKSCCSLRDREYAELVCKKLGIPFHVVNLTEKFRQDVMDKFAEEYSKGRTPNPCIDCNKKLKFEELFRTAAEFDCRFVATGHYARVTQDENGYHLRKAVDSTKDQSYVLYFLTQEQLSRVRFPLGDFTKSDVRGIAKAHGFPNAVKPDSEDICFVPDGDYGAFLNLYTGYESEPGDFIDSGGRIIGRHTGTRNYTIGQRRGLGVSGGRRLYVSAIDPEKNTVTLSDNAVLYRKEFTVSELTLNIPRGLDGFDCQCKIRYAAQAQPARVTITGQDSVTVAFSEPQRAVTPGQAAVFYDKDAVLGGGTIDTIL